MTQRRAVQFTLNESEVRIDCASDARLVDVLRDDLRLTGTKEGCGVGVCGLCSVLVDGALMSACLLLTCFDAITFRGS